MLGEIASAEMSNLPDSRECLGKLEVENIFISAGCNRVVNAAAWGPANLVAFGAHHAVAIFCAQTAKVVQTLPGHKDLVNCVEWLPRYQLDHEDGITAKEHYLLSGSADGVIILWAVNQSKSKWRKCMQIPNPHEKAVSCIAGVMLSSQEAVFASSSSDCTVHIWNALLPLEVAGECNVTFLQSILIGSRAALTVSLVALPTDVNSIMLAMGGLDNNVRLYCGTREGQFAAVCTLKGHQDWIRSLDFSMPIVERDVHEIFLASCGQDKNVRIWRISPRSSSICTGGIKEQGASIKMYIEGPVFKAGSVSWQASMESLLAGHDDWIYSVRWQPPCVRKIPGKHTGRVQPMSILTASMDRTMMIWRPDAGTGLWINEVTVGELGHTALGFYGGMWSSDGDAILAHAFGGSFHMWRNVGSQNADWKPQLVPSGHSGAVSDVSWAKKGQFLLSASHDQTTRLFAPWDWSKDERRNVVSWHEIARPQVHGHDLNCLAVLRGVVNHHYVSGAEEKVARVFEAPGAFLKTLDRITGDTATSADTLRAEDAKILGANMSALSLSQKPIYSQGAQSTKAAGVDVESMETVPDALPAELTEPPLEEHLAWNTLWPESHKLYGHGNELFSMCCDHHGQFLATSCKAQSASVAEIWLWQIGSWRAAGQLQSHTLTVTQMEFSHNDNFLLSVSRDRQFSVFQATKTKNGSGAQPPYKLVSRVEAHKRIIWACSWSPCDRFFATGSRDKSVKLWVVEDCGGACTVTKAGNLPQFKSSVTALSWAPETFCGEYLLATGTEEGLLQLWKVRPILVNRVNGMNDVSSHPERIDRFEIACLFHFDQFSCHVASVNRLTWNEKSNDTHERQDCIPFWKEMQLASCGADHTVRLFNVSVDEHFFFRG